MLLPKFGPKDEHAAVGVTEHLPQVTGSIPTHCFLRRVSVGFKVGKGCFMINGARSLGLHMLLMLCKSVLTGIKVLLFCPFNFPPLMGRFRSA